MTEKPLTDEQRAKLRRPNDPLNLWEAMLTPHYFRHNFGTMLYRAGVDPQKAMKIVGHNEYQTTADIYTHLDQEMMQATAEDLVDVFKKVDVAAKKGRWQKPRGNMLFFPQTGT